MTDWERVRRLRTKGAHWEEIAADRRVGYLAPPGAEPGRALKLQFYRRREARLESNAGNRKSSKGRAEIHWNPARWIAGGAAGAVITATIIVLVFLPAPHSTSPPALGTYPGPAVTGTLAEFNYLSQQHTDRCHWAGVNLGDETANVNWISGLPDGTYLQGACCTPMDFPDYSNQTSSLAGSTRPVIAHDPYNLPAKIAKADVAGEQVSLTPTQQATLTAAQGMTSDNGWCCCQCWAYYAHEGLAKSLVATYGFDAQQVASAINLEDCCGGPGQMNM